MTELKLKHILNNCKHIINKVATKVRVIRQNCSSSNRSNVQRKKNKSNNLLSELGPSLYSKI